MSTAADVARWVAEADPALRGAWLHRAWRDGPRWVLLARHHEGGDPDAKATKRVALEVSLSTEGARCVALPPELVGADDDKQKREQARDAHPFLSLLRRHLLGTRIDALTAVTGDRIALLDCTRTLRPDAAAEDQALARQPRLAIELLGRSPNLVLVEHATDTCLGTLQAGRAGRPLERGSRYQLPPPRQGPPAEPEIASDVAPDPSSLALGRAVALLLREAEEEGERASRHGQLLRAARQGLKRLDGLVGKLEQELAESNRADELEKQADELKGTLATLGRAQKEAQLEEMEKLYKKAKKLRSGQVAVGTRLGEVEQKLEDARALLLELEATEPEDEPSLEAIERTMRKMAFLPKEAAPKPKVQENQGPRSYKTLEGHEVLVGRNDDENDRLTMRIARGNDLFFHVRGCPGSHVILRVDQGRPPNHDSLADAAALAVHFSKARNRGSVDVSYTPRKWVKKPRGAKPGLVQISNEKTIRAGNDPARLRRVLDTRGGGQEDDE